MGAVRGRWWEGRWSRQDLRPLHEDLVVALMYEVVRRVGDAQGATAVEAERQAQCPLAVAVLDAGDGVAVDAGRAHHELARGWVALGVGAHVGDDHDGVVTRSQPGLQRDPPADEAQGHEGGGAGADREPGAAVVGPGRAESEPGVAEDAHRHQRGADRGRRVQVVVLTEGTEGQGGSYPSGQTHDREAGEDEARPVVSSARAPCPGQQADHDGNRNQAGHREAEDRRRVGRGEEARAEVPGPEHHRVGKAQVPGVQGSGGKVGGGREGRAAGGDGGGSGPVGSGGRAGGVRAPRTRRGRTAGRGARR